MANPRRTSLSNPTTFNPNNNSPISSSSENPSRQSQILTSLIIFLKKPHAIPFLLSVFLLLTWVSLRLQNLSYSYPSPQQSLDSVDTQKLKRVNNAVDDGDDDDYKANLVRFTSGFPSQISKDKRGWMVNPVTVAIDAGISGGAVSCSSLHVGQIRPGAMRGNHRHYTCNETFVIWGAETKFRLENSNVKKGYVEVTIGAEEVAVATSPSGTAHSLLNVDPVRTSFFLGCQDSVVTYNTSTNDFNVWKDLS